MLDAQTVFAYVKVVLLLAVDPLEVHQVVQAVDPRVDSVQAQTELSVYQDPQVQAINKKYLAAVMEVI